MTIDRYASSTFSVGTLECRRALHVHCSQRRSAYVFIRITIGQVILTSQVVPSSNGISYDLKGSVCLIVPFRPIIH